MHLILTGATGLVGSGVLHSMLNTPAVTKVSVLSRRPVPMAEGHSKANVIITQDYENYSSEILQQLKDAEGVVWAQGISQTKVGKEEYVKITQTYPLSFARALSTTNDPKPINFIYVSGEGATTTPGRFTPLFGTIKGRAEADLLALSKEEVYKNLRPISLRPCAVDPSRHEEIQGHFGNRTGVEILAMNWLAPVMRTMASAYHTPTRDLGRVLTELAMGDGKPLEGKGIEAGSEGRTITNVGFRRLAGLSK